MRRTDGDLAPSPLAEAVAAVYSGCQRAPPRITLVARDAVEFVRLLHAAGRVFRVGDAVLLALCSCIGLGFVVAAGAATSGGGLLVLATVNGVFLLIIAFGSDLGADSPPGRVQADLLGILLCAALVALAAWWITRSPHIAAAAFSLVASAAGLGRAAVMVNGGLPGRLGLARRCGQWPGTFASAPVNEVVRRTLRRRRADHWDGLLRPAQPDEPTRAEAWHRIEELARRRIGVGWTDAAPALGRLVPPAAMRDGDAPTLAAAIATLERECEAVACYGQAAVLLLPGGSAAPARESAPGRFRWQREPYARALALLQASPVLHVLIALAPSDRAADRLLARAIAADPDPTLRFDAMAQLGFERFFAALAVDPIDRGAAGDLFVAGPPDSVTTLVRVVDRVRDRNGAPHVHWLPVPPGITSAREAVAWTFGKSAKDWDPVLET